MNVKPDYYFALAIVPFVLLLCYVLLILTVTDFDVYVFLPIVLRISFANGCCALRCLFVRTPVYSMPATLPSFLSGVLLYPNVACNLRFLPESSILSTFVLPSIGC